MAAEFQGQFNEAMREAELDDVKKQLQGMNDSVSSIHKGSFNPIQTIRDELKGAIEAPAGSPRQARAPRSPARPRPRRAAKRIRVAPIEPPVVLPGPPSAPVVDPLESFASSLNHEAEASDRRLTQEPDAGPRPTNLPPSPIRRRRHETGSRKPNERPDCRRGRGRGRRARP